MSKNKYKGGLSEKKLAKIGKKIDERSMNQMLASKAMSDPISSISDHLSKRFKLKGLNKADKKMLKTGCMHCFNNKKGKRKAATYKSADGMITCRICGRDIPSVAVSLDDFDKQVNAMREVRDQIGFAKGMMRPGVPVERSHFCTMNREKLANKVDRKFLSIVIKDDEISGNKKHHKNGGNHNNGATGGWY